MTAPAPTPTAPATLTYKDVADLLQCSAKSVERMADAIPGRIRFGRLVRFDRAAVMQWITSGCPTG
jgi:excisionase family DNA binding protein